MKDFSLLEKVRSSKNLRKAWHKVKSSAKTSMSNSIRKEVEEYEVDIDKHLKRIQTQLRKNTFAFAPATGVASKSSSGKTRPIVIAPLPSRIVQRAILQVLQEIGPLKALFEVPTSCGGIAKRGVRYALNLTYAKIMGDGRYYVRSDIKAFFTKIPKSTVLAQISPHVEDAQFMDLLERAIDVVLSNKDTLGEAYYLFPVEDTGVAQGSCLSPLLGNILLNEFDMQLNSKDVLCLRYIDDFIIIGPDKKAVIAKLKQAKKILLKHSLEIYDPAKDPKKAEEGQVTAGFTFLGCDVRPGQIIPAKLVKGRFIKKIKETLLLTKLAIQNNDYKNPLDGHSLIAVLNNISNMTKAWGNQYQFCNHMQTMEQLDHEISELITEHFAVYRKTIAKIPTSEISKRRRALGVHALVDSRQKPIVHSVKGCIS